MGDLYLALNSLGISRLKDGKLMGIAPLNGAQIHLVQQDLWIAGGTGGVTRVGAAGFPNMTTSKDGKLWVATLGGAAMLDLSRLPAAAGRPHEYISEVEVDRKKRNAGRELTLAPGLHHTELQLGSIELSSPERAHMQYRLEGIDSKWPNVKPDGAAVYTTIPHGSYLFHVRASNGDGFWDREGIVYRITQPPFFYETAAFRIMMIAAGCILLTSPIDSGFGRNQRVLRCVSKNAWRNVSASLVTCTTRSFRASRMTESELPQR